MAATVEVKASGQRMDEDGRASIFWSVGRGGVTARRRMEKDAGPLDAASGDGQAGGCGSSSARALARRRAVATDDVRSEALFRFYWLRVPFLLGRPSCIHGNTPPSTPTPAPLCDNADASARLLCLFRAPSRLTERLGVSVRRGKLLDAPTRAEKAPRLPWPSASGAPSRERPRFLTADLTPVAIASSGVKAVLLLPVPVPA